ncbi:hypothetical protein SLS58_005125 [Diplodia intermedia]|uniref:Mg2+ transporter n=1 Tax=Diplodia intermedia TaxID=856260 RepID=A0ABR3TRX7_9PEZI
MSRRQPPRPYYNSASCAPYSRDHGGRHITRTRPEQRFASTIATPAVPLDDDTPEYRYGQRRPPRSSELDIDLVPTGTTRRHEPEIYRERDYYESAAYGDDSDDDYHDRHSASRYRRAPPPVQHYVKVHDDYDYDHDYRGGGGGGGGGDDVRFDASPAIRRRPPPPPPPPVASRADAQPVVYEAPAEFVVDGGGGGGGGRATEVAEAEAAAVSASSDLDDAGEIAAEEEEEEEEDQGGLLFTYSPGPAASEPGGWLGYEDPNGAKRRVASASRLDQAEKNYVSKVLRGISRQFEKPLLTQDGMQGRWMIPNFNQEFDDSSDAPSVNFICFPFFTLEKYGPPSLPENSKAHPKRTLLQTLFSSASRAQDFQQAVAQLPNTPKDHLFHVRQLWAFIVDDKFMITCSSEDPSSIAKDSVMITSQPSAADAVKTAPKYIEVSDECMNVWLLPLEKCKTWFLLHSNFLDTMRDQDIEAGFTYTVTLADIVVNEDDWPKVYEKALRTTVRISIHRGEYSLKIRTVAAGGDYDDDTDTLISEPTTEPVEFPDFELSKGHFHVFTWLARPSNGEDGSISAVRLAKALEEVQKLLLKESHPVDRKGYRSAFIEGKRNKPSYRSVRDALEALPTPTKEAQDWKRSVTGFAKDFVDIFQFYLPLDCQAPAAACFWAALRRMLDVRNVSVLERDIVVTNGEQKPILQDGSQFEDLSRISSYANRVRDLSKSISGLEVPLPSKNNPPDRFVVAWIHTCLAVCHWRPSEMSAFNHHLELAEREMASGLPNFLRSFQDQPLEKRAAAMPLGILSLLTQELLMDCTGTWPDVFNSYRDYYYLLKHRIDDDPLNRAHQKSINAFKQEIEAITAILTQQLTVLNDFRLALDQRRDHSTTTISPSTPYNYTVAPTVLDAAAAAADAKLRGFAGMRRNAEALRAAAAAQIDSNKDRQEAAVYAFTVVTVVFLPLSFVSGFLGMNTADLRDMPHRQWVFWAAALPLTALIVLLGLLGAGELGNAWAWCVGVVSLRLGRGRGRGRGRSRGGEGLGSMAYGERVAAAAAAGWRDDGDEEAAAPRTTMQGGLIKRRTVTLGR